MKTASLIHRQRTILEITSQRLKTMGVEVYYEYLMQLTRELGMHVIVPPMIVKIPVEEAANKPLCEADYGISAFLIWLESGVQVHTWPEYSFASIDVYSCKPYDPALVLSVTNSFFVPDSIIRYDNL